VTHLLDQRRLEQIGDESARLAVTQNILGRGQDRRIRGSGHDVVTHDDQPGSAAPLELTLDACPGDDGRSLYERGLVVFTQCVESFERERERILAGLFGGDLLEDSAESFTVPIEQSVDVRESHARRLPFFWSEPIED